MTLAGLVNLVTALAILGVIQTVALVVVVMLLCEQVGARRSAERRATALAKRIHRLLTRPAPERPEPAETQQLPRVPHAPTYKPGGVAVSRPGTDLMPATHAQLPMPVPTRSPVRR